MNAGIYKITNTVNGHFYIGSAADLRRREGQHFYALSKRSHYNRHLQNAYDRYSKDAFCFSILEHCDKGVLIEREQYYIDTLQPEYNIAPTAGSFFGAKHTSEARAKISTSCKGRIVSDETRARMRISQKGRIVTLETRLKISATNTGRIVTQETRAKMSTSWKIKGANISNRKEKEVLEFVIEYKKSHNGNSPSYDEIAEGCEVSEKSHVKRLLKNLQESGLLELNGRRGITIPNSEWKMR